MMRINSSQQIRDLDWKAVGLASLGIATGFAFYFLYRQGKEIISLKGKLSNLENEAERSLNERAQTQDKLRDLEQRVQNLEQIQAQLTGEQEGLQRGHQTLRQDLYSQQQSLARLNQRLDRGQDVVNRLSRQVGALSRDLRELTSEQEEIRSRFDERQTLTENQIVSDQSVSSHPLSSMSNRESTPFSYPIGHQGSLIWRVVMSSGQSPISEDSSSHLNPTQSNLGAVGPRLSMLGLVGSNLRNFLRRVPK